MKSKDEIIKIFQEDRAKLIAQPDPTPFAMGWVQALAYILGEDCPEIPS